ncbi:twin-arginine translocation signal domain-containing protein [Kitasatospora sp. NBC_01302]|uniref:twin-arginine translocation signal domain-containing protein n=1 Tax=Kitasatospora sp. NBC_01302 TaxID=2903575 RepID=UPI002E159D6E|nr:twin-arginine translocation signal domain-containing protein [Kitasatospora sp. NBC_01302]
MRSAITRRSAVKGAAVLGAATAVGPLLPRAAWAAPAEHSTEPENPGRNLPTSANGWTIEKEANHVSTVWTRTVAGTGLTVDVRIGDVEEILVHVIRRFHYEVEELPGGDLLGWRPIDGLRAALPESNLASGTAVRIRPGASAKGGFFAYQELVLRDILAQCEGVVRWGGDDGEVDESLFYLASGPQDRRVRQLADRLRGWRARPGEGAGAPVDVLSPARRSEADRLAHAQRTS